MSDGTPYLPFLKDLMTVDFFCNKEGEVWLLHDKPLPAIVKWADYDVVAKTITLNTEDGHLLPLGFPVAPLMAQPLENASKISIFLVQEGQIKDFSIVPFNRIDG